MTSDRPLPTARPDPAWPVYTISVVAELAGVHPQTLRGWERQGLLAPARTPGGTRRYSVHDLDRAVEIAELQQEGFGVTAIGRMLALQAEVDELREQIRTLENAANHTRSPFDTRQ